MGLHIWGLYAWVAVLTRLATTRREGVTDVSLGTAADGVVVDNVTLGVDSTNSDAWVLAAKVDTGKAWSTLAVDDTLWAASRRSSKVAREASTHWPAFLLSTVCIGTTGRWLAWINGLCWSNYLGDGRALGERISCVSCMARADGVVVGDRALSIDTTGSRAGVDTFCADTRFVTGAIVVEKTFGFAGNQWVTLVIPDTRTDCLACANPAFCVGATR